VIDLVITHEFQYFKPTSISEIIELLGRHERGAILAGGTDLVNNLRSGAARPDALIDIKGIEEFKRISFEDKGLLIGPGVTFNELIESKLVQTTYPLLMEAASTVGSVGLRNRATMVGNICSAVPCADSAPVLSVYEAEIIVRGRSGDRLIPIEKWFLDVRKTDLRQGEVVINIFVPKPKVHYGACFVKQKRYCGEDLAQASCAIIAPIDLNYRLAFGSVAPMPVRASRIEKLLQGKVLDESLIKQAQDLISSEISPITDIRASKDYRMHMCRVMFTRGIKAAIARLNGRGPDYGINLV